jgi:hypothetical protein
MPRYFFNTADGGAYEDYTGAELPNHAAARVEAVKFAGRMMQNEPNVLWDGREFRVEVMSAQRAPLFTIVCYALDETERRQPAAQPF